jgi:signal transduction histidine kinase
VVRVVLPRAAEDRDTAGMEESVLSPRRLVSRPRIKLWLIVTVLWALFRTATSNPPLWVWLIRCGFVVGMVVLAFGIAERWPRRLPRWLPRWVLQLLVVFLAVPPLAYLSYAMTLGTWNLRALGPDYVQGFSLLAFMGVLFGPWIALGAMLRQREAFAREQALAFQLEKSELERRATDARMKLLQAQVEPHFLFNTLANVRTLVRRSGSAEAAALLDSLIHYLRAAVPRLGDAGNRFDDERQLVAAYLDVMRLRMPDRLSFTLDFAPDTLALACPPAAVLTLVENAVRHGIDPAEDGGRIEVSVQRSGERVRVRVADTGVGLGQAGIGSSGTGLANLRERLQLGFGADARLSVQPSPPRGTLAEIDLPAR